MSRTQIEHFRQFFLNVISVLGDKDNQRQSVYREECSWLLFAIPKFPQAQDTDKIKCYI